MPTEHPTVSFDLTSEPWVRCLMSDGSVAELSLRDVFARAEDVTTIVGEVPTQTFAILRLLLAILYQALPGCVSRVQWGELWQSGLPINDIEDYLDRHRERFDLVHPETPFYQVAALRTAKDDVKDVGQLIFDLPSNNRLFTTRAGAGLEKLSFGEAARWLVHLQAYDPSGIKSGAIGDARVKGGRGYPIGVGWTGRLGGVFAEGTTLRETLLLNFIVSDALPAEREGDTPPWERAPLTAAPDGPADGRPPRGPVDLYTWQSRRVRLVSDGNDIVGSLVANGDRSTPQNRFDREPMTAWRHSPAQEKQLKLPLVYMPREHLPERAFWRGISGLIVHRRLPDTPTKPAATRPPGISEWLAALRIEGYLPDDTRIHLRAIGVVYGSQSSVVSELIDDRMSVALAVLTEDERGLSTAAEDAVAVADRGVFLLARLADNLRIASGGDPVGDADRARERAYSELEGPFLRWLSALSTQTDVAVAAAEWRAVARAILATLGEELVAHAGPAGWHGRLHNGELMTTARADMIFRRGLNTLLGPRAVPEKDASDTQEKR